MWNPPQIERRRRSRAEVVFAVLKALRIGHGLWGGRGAVSSAELGGAVGAGRREVDEAIRYLHRAGIVVSDERVGTVRLSRRGWEEIP